MMQWTDTAACRSGFACGDCRDTGRNGRAFRASVAEAFGGPADFDCPHGRPWNYGRSRWHRLLAALAGIWRAVTRRRGQRGLGDTIAAVTTAAGVKPCGGCKGRQDALNRMLPYGKETPPPSA